MISGCEQDVENSILEAQARHDPAAFTMLYRRYVGPIYRYCYLRLGTQQEAEDATSKVFAKALEGLPRLRGNNLPAWLYRIAHNVVVDMLRARRPTEALEAAFEHADPSSNPEETTLADAERNIVYRAVGQLTGAQRATIELQLAGWPDADIAGALGKSPEAIRMLRLRALRRLRTLLAPIMPERGGEV